jgi:predicted amidohydrolase
MRILLASIDIAWEEKAANLVVCEEVILEAKRKNVDLVIFPEMTLTGFSMNLEATQEKINNSPTIRFFQEMSSQCKIAVLFGVALEESGNVTNNAIFIDKKGEINGTYAKIHLFSFAGENKSFTPGSEVSVVKFQGQKIGLSICYDLRFPEIYSAMSKSATMIINIANWPSKRAGHWNSLLSARAIENQIFLVGVNRTGSDPLGNTFGYSSQIIDPWGNQLEPTEEASHIAIFDVNFEIVDELRTQFLTAADRKIQLYKNIL